MKKGFTLIELLVVIVIIGLISLIVYPSVLKIINDNKDAAYKIQVETIIKAAKEWGVEHAAKLPDPDRKCIISVQKLYDDGYLDYDENNSLTNGGYILISYSKNQYVYEYDKNASDNQECE